MKLRIFGDELYAGTPREIVVGLRSADHGGSRDDGSYINRKAKDFKLTIEGDDLEARCESFVSELVRRGYAEGLLDESSLDMYAIRVHRKARGLSRDKLAQLLDVSPMTINRWESGKNVPEPERYGAIEKALFARVSYAVPAVRGPVAMEGSTSGYGARTAKPPAEVGRSDGPRARARAAYRIGP